MPDRKSLEADVTAMRDGELTLDQLGEKWAGEDWAEPDMHETPSTATEMWERAEDRDRDKPGTWDEVLNLVARGTLTRDEFYAISERVDAVAAERAKVPKVSLSAIEKLIYLAQRTEH